MTNRLLALGFYFVVLVWTASMLPAWAQERPSLLSPNPNWSAGLYLSATREFFPFGICRGAGYASLDLPEGKHPFFAGHLARATNPSLRLAVLPDGQNHWTIEVHNPTAKSIRATIMTPAAFNAVKPFRRETTIPAGSSVILQLMSAGC